MVWSVGLMGQVENPIAFVGPWLVVAPLAV